MTRSIAEASADFAQLAQEAAGAQQSARSEQNALGRLRLLVTEFLSAEPVRAPYITASTSDRGGGK